MAEDALCNDPCGMEPMGCINCPEIGRAEPPDGFDQDGYYEEIFDRFEDDCEPEEEEIDEE